MIYNILGDISLSFWEKLPCYDTYSSKGVVSVHFASIEEQEILKYIENALSLINKLTKMGEMYESEEE